MWPDKTWIYVIVFTGNSSTANKHTRKFAFLVVEFWNQTWFESYMYRMESFVVVCGRETKSQNNNMCWNICIQSLEISVVDADWRIIKMQKKLKKHTHTHKMSIVCFASRRCSFSVTVPFVCSFHKIVLSLGDLAAFMHHTPFLGYYCGERDRKT